MNELLVTKKDLENLVQKYETKTFIKDDPIQFLHRFKNKEDIEIAGFLASIFSYGNRKVFIKKLNLLFEIMENEPLKYVKRNNFKKIKNFDYRFSKGIDLEQIFIILNKLYQTSSLEELFEYGYKKTNSIKGMLEIVVDYFYSNVTLDVTAGFYHLIPDPKKNSTLKRFLMMLRWFVRDGVVDLGIWNFMKKSELLIPIDTHVSKISRELGLIVLKHNNFNTVIELTKQLRKFSKDDPVKYDFALFGYGIEKSNIYYNKLN